ncbi:IclR family transcriptional regulator [Rhodophyticola sp. CCM32]|uniref:IclR family transcriptional regulator n=1 Tax=Rhodophyticola sp. CCM32 TaxID=2916397 RepID=UPI00107F86D8|nr:IclR family transcriptional regulator [Rhodophyticola sp. CCM32]QBY01325.1 IclR family transcriptional regulator [Rhodophyticola sp. CCM32]
MDDVVMNTVPKPEKSSAIESEISLTFRKGLQVMEAFDGTSRLMSLSEIARKTGLNAAVTRRLVRTLLQAGILVEKGQRFEMTVGVMRLARGFLDGHRIAQVIQPILRKSAEKIGENLSFALHDQADATYVAHAYLPGQFTLNMISVGTHVPLHRTASGHAILAHLDRGDWPAECDPDTLGPSVDSTRKRGFSFVEAGLISGVSSVAVPVFSPARQIEGAISMLFPTGRYTADEMPRSVLDEMQQCAVDIGAAG